MRLATSAVEVTDLALPLEPVRTVATPPLSARVPEEGYCLDEVIRSILSSSPLSAVAKLRIELSVSRLIRSSVSADSTNNEVTNTAMTKISKMLTREANPASRQFSIFNSQFPNKFKLLKFKYPNCLEFFTFGFEYCL